MQNRDAGLFAVHDGIGVFRMLYTQLGHVMSYIGIIAYDDIIPAISELTWHSGASSVWRILVLYNHSLSIFNCRRGSFIFKIQSQL